MLVHKQVSVYFRKYTRGYRIFTFSSKLSTSEYYYNFNNVRSQNVDIAIGTKTNAFLPLNNLGLIVMVDEDDVNYFVEQTPKYNVLEVLKFRSNYQDAKLLLTSSALRIESYYHYFVAKYFFLQYLTETESHTKLVNMREEAGDLLLSNTLKQALKKGTKQKKHHF